VLQHPRAIIGGRRPGGDVKVLGYTALVQLTTSSDIGKQERSR
jgi:hypothetical protein